MKLTTSLIREHLRLAANIIKDCYPNFIFKDSYYIRISNARSYWAKIWPGKQLFVSNCFEDIEDEAVAVVNLTGVMIHELIHTIPGCNNHGTNFKRICSIIKSRYPQYKEHLQRCSNMEVIGIKARPYRYQIHCSHCGKIYNYTRKPKWSKTIIETRCSCGVCKYKTLKLIAL